MKNKLHKYCILASAFFLFIFTSVMVCVWVVLPVSNQTPNFSVGKFHASLTQRIGGSMVFFNQKVPYMGSITSFTGDENVKETGCDFYGIYFRTIHYTDKKYWDQWTLIISLWYPIMLFGILPAIFVVKKLRNLKSASTQKPTIEK